MDVSQLSAMQRNTAVGKSGGLNDQFLDPNLFLKLLMVQMQNQDPLSGGSDPTQQISQMATFAMIEQLNNLQGTMESSYMLSIMSQSSDLIGKEVVINLGEDKTVEGVVDKVKVVGGMPLIVIGDKEYNIYQVTEVRNK